MARTLGRHGLDRDAGRGASGTLAAVGGTSNNYWAVGGYSPDGTINIPLALHCC